MDFLFGASPTQQRIDKATSDLLMASDWSANLEICDEVNRAKDGGKDILKAISKRMGNKTPQVAKLALALLDACVNNGKPAFHALVHEESFLNDVVKVATRKGQDSQVRDQALILIETWAEAFDGHKEFPRFRTVCEKLKADGVDFPPRDNVARAPVFTPPASAAPATKEGSAASAESKSGGGGGSTATGGGAGEEKGGQERSEFASTTDAYVKKTKLELQEVMSYVKMLHEMLAVTESGPKARKNETIRSLLHTLHEVQSRITRMLVELDHEGLVDLLIQVNEHIREVVDAYKAICNKQPYRPSRLADPKALLEVGGAAGGAAAGDVPASELDLRGAKDDDDDDDGGAAEAKGDDGFDALAKRNDGGDSDDDEEEEESLERHSKPKQADILGIGGEGEAEE